MATFVLDLFDSYCLSSFWLLDSFDGFANRGVEARASTLPYRLGFSREARGPFNCDRQSPKIRGQGRRE
jgi:hypothetical protein